MKKTLSLLLIFSTILSCYSFFLNSSPKHKNTNKGIPSDSLRLGAFSTSLNVQNLKKSKEFYEKLGFKVLGGSKEQKYLIMKNENTLIGLFEGMFEGNILTFNPGWNENGKNMETFDDIRTIEKHLKDSGISLDTEIEKGMEGPASLMLKDPDGNLILIDQHR